uniref:Uncharacterized protein n=1 Tax=Panthera leo TaxID=9689 RepID=A0A8C8XH82_PANLE
MSWNRAVWGRLRGQLHTFRGHLLACGAEAEAEAAAYGRCVQASTAPGGRLTKDLCARAGVQAFRAKRTADFSGQVVGRGGFGFPASCV